MRHLILLVLLLSIIGFFVLKQVQEQVRKDLGQIVAYPSPTVFPIQKVGSVVPKTTTLFAPSWTLAKNTDALTGFDQYIYFGLTPTAEGIPQVDATMSSVQRFLDSTPSNSKKLLAIAMTDSDSNFTILKKTDSQKAVIRDAIVLAQKEGFSGIVLDLEVSAIPFPSLEDQITTFVQAFSTTAKKQGLSFSLTLFGDTFYRIRPFNVKEIAKSADTVWIMSYDFSKARGNPGPNFPLHSKDAYGYDMTEMADDFLQLVPNKKVGVVFGLFGYDWIVDSKGQSKKEATPLTDKQIQAQFLNGCQYADCTIHRDTVSSETQIRYADDFGNKHVVWFEDMESVAAKERYLESRGITTFSYWAYSYF